jgi:hypothetical protein
MNIIANLLVEEGTIRFIQENNILKIIPGQLQNVSFQPDDFDESSDEQTQNDRLKRNIRENPLIADDLGEDYDMFYNPTQHIHENADQLTDVPMILLTPKMQQLMLDLYEYYSRKPTPEMEPLLIPPISQEMKEKIITIIDKKTEKIEPHIDKLLKDAVKVFNQYNETYTVQSPGDLVKLLRILLNSYNKYREEYLKMKKQIKEMLLEAGLNEDKINTNELISNNLQKSISLSIKNDWDRLLHLDEDFDKSEIPKKNKGGYFLIDTNKIIDVLDKNKENIIPRREPTDKNAKNYLEFIKKISTQIVKITRPEKIKTPVTSKPSSRASTPVSTPRKRSSRKNKG